MKSLRLFTLALAGMFLFAFTYSPNDSNDRKAFDFSNDYQYGITNCELEKRFETQFADLIPKVTKINVHHNSVNDFYYAVHGLDANNHPVVDYFKATGYEIENEIYDFINLSDHNASYGRFCRENPDLGNCYPNNTGVICGKVRNGGCDIF